MFERMVNQNEELQTIADYMMRSIYEIERRLEQVTDPKESL